MSLHYLVKGGCSKCLLNTGFFTITLLRFGVKVKRAYCPTTFLLGGHCQTWAGCPETIFYVSTGWQRVSDKYRPTGSDQQEDLATLGSMQLRQTLAL